VSSGKLVARLKQIELPELSEAHLNSLIKETNITSLQFDALFWNSICNPAWYYNILSKSQELAESEIKKEDINPQNPIEKKGQNEKMPSQDKEKREKMENQKEIPISKENFSQVNSATQNIGGADSNHEMPIHRNEKK